MNSTDKYLFCYFTGNLPQEESVHFAVSDDGYHFRALNGNQPIFMQRLGKQCARDPFLFRDEKGGFHIIATDMRCHDGWNSNHSMVMWDSDDLVTWKNERIYDFTQFAATENCDRVWAPQVIFDPFRGEYMIYWSHHNTDDSLNTVIWHLYTDDLQHFTTEPTLLFAPQSGMAGIDADIIEKDGQYYLFFADEAKDAICYAVADRPNGPYREPKNNKASVADTRLEGNCLYRIAATGQYVMIADQFVAGGYFMQESTDMLHYTAVPRECFAIDHLHARHGSMLPITTAEYEQLLAAFGV